MRKECKGVQRKWKGRRKGKKSRFSIISRYRGRISVYHWVQPRILERSSSDAIPDHPTCPISTLVVPRQVGDLFQITQISRINDNDFKRIIINNIIKFDENLLFQSSFEIPAKFVGAHARGQYFRAWGGKHAKKHTWREILSFSRSTLLFHPSSSLPARAPERKTSVERDPTQPKHFHAESFAQGEVENEKMRGLFDGGWKGVEIDPMDYRLNQEGPGPTYFPKL